MLYTVTIPAKFAAEFATGSVNLMNAGIGLTTPLVSSTGGTIVGAASLVPVSGAAAELVAGSAGAAAGGSGGAVAATAGGVALGPILAIGLGGLAIVGLGVFLWRRSRKAVAADVEEMVELIVECDEGDAEAVLAEVQDIVKAAAARLAS